MDQIIPGLWIGDLACALATDYLSIAGITHIVTAMKQRLPSPITLPDGRVIDQEHMFHVNLDDVDNAPILVHFPAAADFIDAALEHDWLEDDEAAAQDGEAHEAAERVHEEPPSGRGPGQWATMGEGTVLVHCHAGISRSVALVTAYLMRTRRMGRDEALRLIQSRRSQACPNPGFMHQLELFESGGYNVDVRNQRIRRFLMSQSSILRGDSIDDVMLSYYPSPFHSPANSFTSGSGSALGGLQQLSSLDNEGAPQARQMSRRGSSASAYGGSASPVSSLAMSRQNSRKAVSTAAAKVGSERHRRTRSRSEGMLSCANPPRSLVSMTTLVPAKDDQGKILDLSKSPPISDQSMELFDEDDDSASGALRDEKLQNLIRQQFSSVRDPQEVMITVSSKNLPGGVTKVRGNQTTTDAAHDTDKSGAARQLSANGAKPATNAQRLPKPHFHGRKLRCKKCRRELAAQDHVVEHEPGKGKDAFDVRKREKDVEQKSRDGRLAMGGGASDGRSNERQMSMEERFGAQKRPEKKTEEEQEEHEEEPAATPPPPTTSTYKSAASLSAQLPPHLAALRLGRNPAGGGVSTPASPTQPLLDNPSRRPAEPHPSGTTNGGGDLRRLLHSPLCTSYFVEPLAWMSGLRLGDVAGRLDCPNQRCSAKLGSWDWAGMQCACGAWVTPAFALHRSKVDEV